jgi:hypothetical protein
MRSILGRTRRRHPDHPRPSPRARSAAYETQGLVGALTPGEWAAVLDLLGEEIARGWVPKRTDIEAALGVLQIPVPATAMDRGARG